MFEKEYNLYAAKGKIKNTEHINMAYNDFLELGIEGGIISMLFWILFLGSSWYYSKKYFDYSIIPIIVSFIIIQLTNFGFKAIPAMVLFILYTTFMTNNIIHKNITYKSIFFPNLFISWTLLFFSFFYMFFISNKIGTHYNEWMVKKKNINENTIEAYKKFTVKLHNYSPYHENFGDAYQELKNFRPAVNQYLIALNTSSKPDIFLKTAYCYLRLGNYDSCEYYYKTAEDIEPNKLIPQFSLLKMYLQKVDTFKILQQSEKILKTESKIVSNRSIEIKKYADSVYKKWRMFK